MFVSNFKYCFLSFSVFYFRSDCIFFVIVCFLTERTCLSGINPIDRFSEYFRDEIQHSSGKPLPCGVAGRGVGRRGDGLAVCRLAESDCSSSLTVVIRDKRGERRNIMLRRSPALFDGRSLYSVSARLIWRLASVSGASEQGPFTQPPSQAITSTNWAIGFLAIAFSRAAFFLSSPSMLVVV